MKKKKPNSDLLDALLDAASDAVMASSDAEILAESKQEYPDPAARVKELRAMAAERIIASKKQRLSLARKALDAAQSQVQGLTKALTSEEMRARIQRLLPGSSSAGDWLTLAFRKGEDMSDADMQSLLEDLEDLARLNKKDE